jgi:predicted polyphosphate/ATP-dependent NAD kinase
MGGKVGLKGTDGVTDKAILLGAVPQAPDRAKQALNILQDIKDEVEVFTCSGEMGENEAKEYGFITKVIWDCTDKTNSRDTIEAAKKMLDLGIDFIIFAGGDGTARDIYNAIGDKVVVVGIPAGVKIHSPVYAKNPAKAGELAKLYLMGKIKRIQEAEVLDIDEEAYRLGNVNTKLHGYLKIPFERGYAQNRKAGTPLSENASQNAISFDVIDNMKKDTIYIVGPGTTTRPIMQNLNLPNTLLGVDVIWNKQLIALDVAEKQLLEITAAKECKLVITPIGGQGYLFGRGNQQISPEVIKNIGKKNIIVIATKEKISELHGNPLLVDTGDSSLDAALTGYMRVVVGYKEQIIYPIA